MEGLASSLICTGGFFFLFFVNFTGGFGLFEKESFSGVVLVLLPILLRGENEAVS